jgi:hypothetical protein
MWSFPKGLSIGGKNTLEGFSHPTFLRQPEVGDLEFKLKL